MTTHQAKKLVKSWLENNVKDTTFKLTARTVDFTDLARGGCIFVKVHGWKPNPLWFNLQNIAKENGFRVEAK